MRISLIIAAGGQGSRFKPKATSAKKSKLDKIESPSSKLFYPMNGVTVLETSILKFLSISSIQEILAIVPKSSLEWVKEMIKKNRWKMVRTISGGKSRAESVLKGIRAADPKNDWIMVHDGARPLIDESTVCRLINGTAGYDGAILAKAVVPTLKKADEDRHILATVDRTSLYEAETPQLMKRDLLLKAYEKEDALKATDEAALLESVHGKVKIIENEHWNPKITNYRDYEMIQAYLNQSRIAAETKVGFGKDIHRLVKGRKFILGGIHLPYPKGPMGHSDGDPLMHAICDAILGCLSKGDIGEWFSDKDKRFKNIDSSKMLKFCVEEARKEGWQFEHVDTIIHLEKPKLNTWKNKIAIHIARLMKLAEDQVSVKAKTMEGFGPIGEGLAVGADAVVTLRRSSE